MVLSLLGNHLSRKGAFGAIFVVAALMAVVVSSFVATNVSAGREVNSYLSNGNAGAYCGSGSTRGMVWLSNDNADYYSTKVIVGSGASWVGVQVRGAVNACSTPPQDGDAETYAADVRPNGASAGVLSITGYEFWRGNLSRYATNGWSWGHDAAGGSGSHLDGSLNVAGIAPCSAAVNGISTGSMYVEISRFLRYRQGGVIIDRGSGVDAFYVSVERSCPLNFNLNPSISATPTVAEPGAEVTVTPRVENTGTTDSAPAQWQVTAFTVPRGAAIPNAGGGRSATVPLDYYVPSDNRSTVAQGTNTVFGTGGTPLTVGPQIVGDLEVGTRLCYALSVQPFRHDNSEWNHSAPFCITIAKSPKVQVQGSDLIVGRQFGFNAGRVSNITTSATNKGGIYYGSWGEYALIPSGTVSGMASGSGYVGGSPSGVICDLSILTFTIGAAGGGCSAPGRYTHASAVPNVVGRFPIRVAAADATPGRPANPAVLNPASVDVSTLSGQYQLPAGRTSLVLDRGPGDSVIARGQRVVINAPGATVTIRSNIVYTGENLSSLNDIPQVVIIANNIIIEDDVTNIDAWLVAVGTGTEGKINTCGTGPGITETSALTDSICNQRLTVNGPLMANHLIMRRTAGSGTAAQSGDPAEVFNLRADAYFWATDYNLSSGRLTTAETKELPPRY